jgi:hypothetical protein
MAALSFVRSGSWSPDHGCQGIAVRTSLLEHHYQNWLPIGSQF